jgi:hypothetical protein
MVVIVIIAGRCDVWPADEGEGLDADKSQDADIRYGRSEAVHEDRRSESVILHVLECRRDSKYSCGYRSQA